MNKLLILLSFSLCTLLFSGCGNSEDNNDVTITGKSYIFRNDTLLVSITTSSVIIYINHYAVFQNLYQVKAIGTYPNILIALNDDKNQMELNCAFNSSNNFTAYTTKALLYGGIFSSQYRNKPFSLPAIMNFSVFNEVLDKNGDGILDEYQSL